jgi:hypothetical protein
MPPLDDDCRKTEEKFAGDRNWPLGLILKWKIMMMMMMMINTDACRGASEAPGVHWGRRCVKTALRHTRKSCRM